MPSPFAQILTAELQQLNTPLTVDIVAGILATAVTKILARNEAKVILRRVVDPTGQGKSRNYVK